MAGKISLFGCFTREETEERIRSESIVQQEKYNIYI